MRAAAAERRTRCEALLLAVGLPVPTTIRELAETMVALGIATQEDGVWSMPDLIPGPETVLALTDAERDELTDMRRIWDGDPAAAALHNYLTDDLDCPDEFFTSVDRLSRATGQGEDEVRRVLGRMIQDGEVRLQRGTAREQVALETLKSHERFHFVTDWELYDENRFTNVHEPRNDDQGDEPRGAE
ncbi:DUF6042 family protein [Streptomyces sp. NPDC000410]|uniref:DUF6042 family protein n=1 Tax=Streptomyces sp. NPDC000410 TaxID=3154254 RepID=UPI003331060A